MGLWKTTKQLPSLMFQRVPEVYNNAGYFVPFEVREHLSEWIEKHILIDIDPDDPGQSEYIKAVMCKFVEEVDRTLLSLQQTNQTFKIQKRLKEVSIVYPRSGKYQVDYFKAIRECLLEEMRIVTRYEVERRWLKQLSCDTWRTGFPSLGGNGVKSFAQLLAEAEAGSEDLLGLLRRLEQEQTTFAVMYEEGVEINRVMANAQSGHWSKEARKDIHKRNLALQEYIADKILTVKKLRWQIANGAELVLRDLVKLTRLAEGHFNTWWEKHGPGANSGEPAIELNVLQECYERTYRSLVEVHAHLTRAQRLDGEVEIQSSIFNEEIDSLHPLSIELLSSLTRRSVVVEEEPPQVLKPNMPFSATLRLILHEHLKNVDVKATAYVVDELLALRVFDRCMANPIKPDLYELLNHQGETEFDEEARIFRIRFRNMKWKSNATAKPKDVFWLAFRIQYFTEDGKRVTESWISSLAMTIAKTSKETMQASALVAWHNAFAVGADIEKFTICKIVYWRDYANLLSQKFKGVTGRGLSQQDRYFLAKMFFNGNDDYMHLRKRKITYHLQHKKLCNRNFTFWQWIFEAMMLARKFINQLWQASLILGFVTLEEAKMLLSERSCPGAFIVIFNTRKLAAVDIVYTKDIANNVTERLTFTSLELYDKPLHIRLMKIPELTFFFPRIPKEKAITEWCSDTCRDSLVWGLRSVEQARLMLGSKSPIGTFVAVLSRSTPGAVDLVWVAGTGRDRFRWTTFTNKELIDVPLHQRIMQMKELKGLTPKEDVVKHCCPGRIEDGRSPPTITISDDEESVYRTNTKNMNDVYAEFMDISPPSSQNELSPTLSSIESGTTPASCQSIDMNEIVQEMNNNDAIMDNEKENNNSDCIIDNVKEKNCMNDMFDFQLDNILLCPEISCFFSESTNCRTTPASCQSINMNENVQEMSNNDAIMDNAKENNNSDCTIDKVKEKNCMNDTFDLQHNDILLCPEVSCFFSKSTNKSQLNPTMPHENELNVDVPTIDKFADMSISEVGFLFKDISTDISSHEDLASNASHEKSLSSNFDISRNKSLSHNSPPLCELLENMCDNAVLCENKSDHHSIPKATSAKAVELGTESILRKALSNPNATNSKSHYNNTSTNTDASTCKPSAIESKNMVNAAEISQTRSFLKVMSLTSNNGSHLKRPVSIGHTPGRVFLPTSYSRVTNALNTQPPCNNIHCNTGFLHRSSPYPPPSNVMSLLQSMSYKSAGALSNSNNMTMRAANNNHNPVRFNPQNVCSNMDGMNNQSTFNIIDSMSAMQSYLRSQDAFRLMGVPNSATLHQQYISLANAYDQSLFKQMTADRKVITNGYISERMGT